MRRHTHSINRNGCGLYAWLPDPNLSCTNCATPQVSATLSNSYFVEGTDANGCRNGDTIGVEVIHPFNLQVTNESLQVCEAKSVVLRASGTDIYSWSPTTGINNPNVPNPYASPDVTTQYTVTGSDSHHCFTQSKEVTVVVNPNPQFTILDSIIVAKKGDVNPINTTGSPDIIQWHWQPPQGLSCIDCPQPLSTAIETVTYTAVATTALGCTDTAHVSVHVLCNQNKIFIPSAFTPDGDGKNDYFYVLSDIQNPIKLFSIYARNGELLYSKSNIISNTATQGWDGTKNGARKAPGTYIYHVEVICNGEVVPFTGTVTLIR